MYTHLHTYEHVNRVFLKRNLCVSQGLLVEMKTHPHVAGGMGKSRLVGRFLFIGSAVIIPMLARKVFNDFKGFTILGGCNEYEDDHRFGEFDSSEPGIQY